MEDQALIHASPVAPDNPANTRVHQSIPDTGKTRVGQEYFSERFLVTVPGRIPGEILGQPDLDQVYAVIPTEGEGQSQSDVHW